MLVQSEAGNREYWDDTVHTKEEREARLQRKAEAAIKRERARAYAFSHQVHSFDNFLCFVRRSLSLPSAIHRALKDIYFVRPAHCIVLRNGNSWILLLTPSDFLDYATIRTREIPFRLHTYNEMSSLGYNFLNILYSPFMTVKTTVLEWSQIYQINHLAYSVCCYKCVCWSFQVQTTIEAPMTTANAAGRVKTWKPFYFCGK